MKHVNRIVGLLIVALLFGSQAWAERISQVDAALVANNFMNVASQNSAVKKAVPAKRMVLKASAAQEENLYYVYENADGEGWVIVAANDVVTPILAYSETGHFRTDNMPVNVRKWMGKYNNFVKKIEADGVQASEEAVAEWAALKKGTRKAVSVAVVGPLIKTTWDQDAPYWNLCPGTGTNKAYTGCVATAMAQVMNYWQWPVKGTGSHTYQPLDPNTGQASSRYKNNLTVNFGETTYDWANMKNSYSGSYTDAQATAVATLMYHCGVASEMMYGNYDDDGSGTYTVNYNDWEDHACAQNALWMNFGYKKSTITSYMRDGYTYQGTKYYDSWTEANWIAMLKEELDKNHPIMYDGAGPTTNDGGHSFICDGYDNSSTTKFHFNWGWSGDNDGYYTLSNLVPGGGGAGGGSYNFSYDQSVIIGIVPDKPNLPDQNVTWMANGAVFANNIATAGVVTLPTNKPANCEGGKVFVGWTATAEYEAASIAPTYIKGGEIIEKATTYYAVYAAQESGSGETKESLTFSSLGKANQTSVDGEVIAIGTNTSITFNKGTNNTTPKYYDTGASIRLYGGSNCVVSSSNGEMSKIEFTFGSGDGENEITANTGTYSNGTWTGSASSVTFTVGGTSGHRRFAGVAVTAGGGTSYKDYSTACGAVEPCVLTGIELNTEKATTAFVTGAEFNYNGLVVTANYSNCSSKKVNPASVSTPDMSVAGEKTVTVSYTENEVTKEATYKITVSDPATYTIGFYNNGSLIGEAQQVVEGQSPEVPAAPEAACTSYTFYGWYTETLAKDNTEKPTVVSNFTAVKDQNYYAVFTKTEAGEGGETTTTLTMSDYEAASFTAGTFTFTAGGSGTSATYNANGKDARFYAKNTLTISSANEMTKIVFNISTQGKKRLAPITASTGTIATQASGDETVTWTGEATEVTFTVGDQADYGSDGSSKAGQLDFLSVAITTGGGASSTTYYSTVVSCDPTEVSTVKSEELNMKSKKLIIDGKLYIMHDGRMYNVQGTRVK